MCLYVIGRVVPYLDSTVSHASILTIICVSIDRYFAICHPMKAQYLVTGGRTIKYICAVWVFSLIATSPYLALSYTEDAEFYDGRLVKVCRIAIDSAIKEAYVFGMIAIFFGCPFFILALLYAIIVVRLRTDEQDLCRQDPNGKPSSIIKSRRQVVHMLISIIVVFFVCLLPMRALTLWFVYGSVEQKQNMGLELHLNLLNFSRIFFYCNSVINPILYNIVSSRFREAFKRAISRKYRQSRRASMSTGYSAARATTMITLKRDVPGSFAIHYKSSGKNKKQKSMLTNGSNCPKHMDISRSLSDETRLVPKNLSPTQEKQFVQRSRSSFC